jgi:hypothetical protein
MSLNLETWCFTYGKSTLKFSATTLSCYALCGNLYDSLSSRKLGHYRGFTRMAMKTYNLTFHPTWQKLVPTLIVLEYVVVDVLSK